MDIFEVLENISHDFPAFKERVKKYSPPQKTPIFNPFSSFYGEWSSFSDQNTENPLEAQKKIARQYIFITLLEIKTRYAYQRDPQPGEITSLRQRIETLEKLRAQFFSEKPSISLDFSAEKDIINESLKKEIARYK